MADDTVRRDDAMTVMAGWLWSIEMLAIIGDEDTTTIQAEVTDW